MILTVFPAKESVDDAQNLQLQRIAQFFPGDDLMLDENEAEALQSLFLDLKSPFELFVCDRALFDQHMSEPILDLAVESIRGDDLPIEERDRYGIREAAESQHPGFPLQADQLEDVGETEVLECSFECHIRPPIPLFDRWESPR